MSTLSDTPVTDPQRPLSEDERWLTPAQIAARFGYTTDKAIVKAIGRGELRAYHSPSGRGLFVRSADYSSWCEEILLYTPRNDAPVATNVPTTPSRARPKRKLPTLNYTKRKRP
jgi:hypothetical protein